MIKTVAILIEGKDEQKPIVNGLKANSIGGLYRPFETTLANGLKIVVCTTGVGVERSMKVTSQIIERFKPDLVISTGTCGALTETMKLHDWLLTGTVKGFAPEENKDRKELETLINPDLELLDLFKKALSNVKKAPHTHEGILASVYGKPIIDLEEKNAIVKNNDVIAVDMESYGIASSAAKNGIPWMVARVVVDTPSVPLPDFGDLNVVTGRPSLFRIAKFVITQPIQGPKTLYKLWTLVRIYGHQLVQTLAFLKI